MAPGEIRPRDPLVLLGCSYGLAVRNEVTENAKLFVLLPGRETSFRQVPDDERDRDVFLDPHRAETTPATDVMELYFARQRTPRSCAWTTASVTC